jgi:hypothetical protein
MRRPGWSRARGILKAFHASAKYDNVKSGSGHPAITGEL